MSSTKNPKYRKDIQCSWTLYFIYFNLFNTNINKSAGFLTLSADIFLLSNGLLMIPIPPNIKSSSLMNFLWSQTSVRTGLIRSSSLTTKNVMARRSALSAAGQNATFLMTALAPAVMHPSPSCTKTMVPRDSFSVKSVLQGSPQMKVASPL